MYKRQGEDDEEDDGDIETVGYLLEDDYEKEPDAEDQWYYDDEGNPTNGPPGNQQDEDHEWNQPEQSNEITEVEQTAERPPPEPAGLLMEHTGYSVVNGGEFDMDALYGRFTCEEPAYAVAERVATAQTTVPSNERAGVDFPPVSAVGAWNSRPDEPSGPPAVEAPQTRSLAVAPPIDRSQVEAALPPVTLAVQTGFNCVVLVTIGGVKFRVVFDSGAARSLIRTSFAEQLRRNARTKTATYGPRPLSRPVILEGVVKGGPPCTLSHATQVTLDLKDSVTGHAASLEACFGEMAECADPLILGFPELARFGYAVEEDDDGHIWVTLSKLGITLLAETPEMEPCRRCKLRPTGPRVLEGPCVEAIDVYCPPEATNRCDWIADDAWPGVRVVEGQLKPGASQVIVAVEPGARALLTGSRVPWRIEKQGPETVARAAICLLYTSDAADE